MTGPRIGYFTNSYPRATDTFIQREIRVLRSQGIDVRTFSVRRVGEHHDVGPDVTEEKRRTYFILPVRFTQILYANAASLFGAPRRYFSALFMALHTRAPGARGLGLQIAYFQEAVVLASELRRQRITHLHNHFGDNSGTVTLLASILNRISYSITIHGPHIFFDPTHWALREKLRYSRFIACISHYCMSQVMLFSDPVDWWRLKIIRCGVDIDSYRVIDIRARASRLLYTGRLDVEKGLPVLFEALRGLMAQGYDFVLTLVGDGKDRGALESLGVRLGISARLVFTGYVDQTGVRDFLQTSDIFVLPSFAEGVPVSLMEAMASGVPVLATHVGGIAELVTSERTGLLVPPADSVALGNAIARYIDDFELRRTVSRQGREFVGERYNLNQEVGRLAELLCMP